MTFKEFDEWCSERLFDDYLTDNEYMICFDILQKIHRGPLSKQEDFWHKHYENNIIKQIVIPTNNKIIKTLKK